ncbi:histidine kinase [Roseibacillus persicicus]|uniref:histidine kinase n=1 Tax=Roseibacillus persicicus TaxID=454148 RepID=UPI00398A8B28
MPLPFFLRLALFPIALCGQLFVAAAETAIAPYQADPHTLHLWHLDEAKAPFRDEGPTQTDMLGLFNGARPSQNSYPGLGEAISFNHNVGGTPGNSDLMGAVLIAKEKLAEGAGDRVDSSFHYFGEDGAFTFEAVVKLDQHPSEAEVIALSILSMDGEDNERIFNFRIERQGFLTFNPLPDSGSTGGAMATIPTVGPHALNTKDWFHVAVTYNGREETSANLRLYWTRLDSGATEANLIGGGTLSNDLNGRLGDLAIGNEARYHFNAEAEPFCGNIDEVRISSLARHETDYLFVPGEMRVPSEKFDPSPSNKARSDGKILTITEMRVDGKPVALPDRPGSSPLTLPPGIHRIDFDLQFNSQLQSLSGLSDIRCQMQGFDESWRNADAGMSLTFQVLDAQDRIVSQNRHLVNGSSDGWKTPISESTFGQRAEPLFIPLTGRKLRITLDSGPPDTTGNFAISQLNLSLASDSANSFWPNSNFAGGENLDSPAGVPRGWTRSGGDPAIAQVDRSSTSRFLVLVDGEQSKSGSWTSEIDLDPEIHLGKTISCTWKESYNVFAKGVHQSSFLNVSSGDYVFRAVGLINGELIDGPDLVQAFRVRPALSERAWFWPALTSATVALFALALFRHARRLNRRRLRQMWFENAIEQDRIRIARDMHDDLGNRICFLRMTAARAKEEAERDPAKLKQHLGKLGASARELVNAMNELVWAVDPKYDTLDHLASHLTRVAEDVFGDSTILCRFDIPSRVPDYVLGSDYRHHISLAVKEALYNVVKHAGPCEVHLSLDCSDGQLNIEVRDNGCGFDPEQTDPICNGLKNLVGRMKDLGGSCKIISSLGKGTQVCLIAPLPTQDESSCPIL